MCLEKWLAKILNHQVQTWLQQLIKIPKLPLKSLKPKSQASKEPTRSKIWRKKLTKSKHQQSRRTLKVVSKTVQNPLMAFNLRIKTYWSTIEDKSFVGQSVVCHFGWSLFLETLRTSNASHKSSYHLVSIQVRPQHQQCLRASSTFWPQTAKRQDFCENFTHSYWSPS